MSDTLAPPPIPVGEQALIDAFLDAMWLEKGVSNHTLSAYRADLCGLASWLVQRNKSLSSAGRSDLMAYLAALLAYQVIS